MFKRKGGGSKAFWTMLIKTALFSHDGFPNIQPIYLRPFDMANWMKIFWHWHWMKLSCLVIWHSIGWQPFSPSDPGWWLRGLIRSSSKPCFFSQRLESCGKWTSSIRECKSILKMHKISLRQAIGWSWTFCSIFIFDGIHFTCMTTFVSVLV